MPRGFECRAQRCHPAAGVRRGRRVSHLATLFLFAAASAGAGVSFVIQQAVNADLRNGLGSAAWAGFVSYVGGTICMLLLGLILRDPLPSPGAVAQTNWGAWRQCLLRKDAQIGVPRRQPLYPAAGDF